MRLVHLTDPHLSSLAGHSFWTLEGKRRLGWLSWWRKRRHHLLASVLGDVSAAVRAAAPDLVVVSGDLCQVGLPEEIEAGRAWLDTLASHARVMLVPGNHDVYRADAAATVRARWAPYLQPAEAAGQPYPALWPLGEIDVIGLDSAVPTPFWSAAGQIGEEQLAALAALLAARRGRFRCVVLHHPPQPGVASRRKGLRDAAALVALLEREGVQLVLHGHLHESVVRRLGRDTRVLVTAAASSALARTPAALRVIDVQEGAAHWRVAQRLLAWQGPGVVAEVEAGDWDYARPGAE